MSLYGGINIVGEPDLENVRKLDLLSMPCVEDMMRIGIAIDREWFYDLSDRLAIEIDDLSEKICSYIPPEKLGEFIQRSDMDSEEDYLPMNPNSTDQLAKLLFEILEIGKGKVLKRTKSGDQISTGKRQLEQLKREHPILPLVLQYREYLKLKGTYTDTLPKQAVLHKAGYCERCSYFDDQVTHEYPEWVIHTTLLWTRTNTGRFSSKKPNLQNQPIRSALGRESRKGFRARKGKKLISIDFSQLQLRFLAHLSICLRMIQIYWDKKDIHTETAMEAFGLPEDRIDPLAHRAPAKNVNFAIAFGETHKGLFDQLVSDSYGKSGIPVPDWLTLDWCKGFIERWFGIYEEVLPYMETQYYRARRYGCTWDMFGRIRAIPEVESVHKKTIAEGLRYAGNMPIQAPDSGVMRLAMSEVRDEICVPLLKDGIWCRPLLTIHDEIILETDEEVAEMVQWEGERIMGNVLRDRETGESHVRVPIVAQGKVMDRWSK